jgi:DNA-binding XRE family transcriptional regulator
MEGLERKGEAMPEETKGFMDATCRSCRKRIGWFGRVVDQPACPRCGWKPDRASMEAAQAEMDDFRQMLVELHEANPGWEHWRKARVAAGLTLLQAAKLLEVEPSNLSEIEQGRQSPSEALAGRMARCYEGQDPCSLTP